MKRVVSGIACAVLLVLLPGCAQIGSVVGNLMTQKTSNLGDVAMQVRLIQNLYPKEAATTEVSYASDKWVPGSNSLVVNFTKRQGIGMYTIDGVIKNGADTLPYWSNGVYARTVSDLGPQPVEVVTSSGQTFKTTVTPVEPIKIKSVNGGTGTIDFNKDLVLEFEHPKGAKNTEGKAYLILDVMGTTSFVEIASFRLKDKVTIPAVAFRNIPNLKPRTGPTWLLVERFKVEPVQRGVVGACQVISVAWDHAQVTVTGELDKVDFINTKIESGEDDKKLVAELSKPNAYTGKPFSTAKKMALVSLSVRATKLMQTRTSTNTTKTYGGGYVTTTTTTTTSTRKFPTLPDAYWDKLLDNLYKDVSGLMKKRYNIELIPMEKVLASKTYQDLEEIKDEASVVEVSKSYKGTKSLIPTSLSSMISSVSSTFAADRTDARLIEELDVDGLISVTLDLEMPWFDEAAKATLAPRLAIRISGEPNGYLYGPTIYTQGVVYGMGDPISDAIMESGSFPGEFLEGVVRLKDLNTLLNKALDEQAAREKELGYQEIWNLRK
ncbi:MAG: hypothetical protein HUU10_13890 [Bacteroidetes bacterium]|nr:hypothetical protein [Bacteroidota bacterium]